MNALSKSIGLAFLLCSCGGAPSASETNAGAEVNAETWGNSATQVASTANVVSAQVPADGQRIGDVAASNSIAANERGQTRTKPREHPRIARLREHCARNRNDPGALEPDQDELPPNLQGHSWRCRNGIVLICNLGASGRRCMSEMGVDAERMAAFREFCRGYPGEDIPGAITTGLHSSWTCRGTQPEQTSAGSVDQDGYQRGAWRPL